MPSNELPKEISEWLRQEALQRVHRRVISLENSYQAFIEPDLLKLLKETEKDLVEGKELLPVQELRVYISLRYREKAITLLPLEDEDLFVLVSTKIFTLQELRKRLKQDLPEMTRLLSELGIQRMTTFLSEHAKRNQDKIQSVHRD